MKMARHTICKKDFRGDLFLSAKSPDNFNNNALKDAIRHYEIKERNIMATKRPNDWLTAWQMKNE